ncbi:uncharacterized protein LOC111263211 isoform X1 [Varroa jacobsoni]|uniref:Uncharacterized protein n=1 Tax=Varroa destructor TaxID=109461 RepID=A0A7M7K1Q7_VARDE|nr:uncharacterized protein LOC111250052 isoform X1 [Varroa destructor]XP_022693847.1 uncharacterized protein LOC111263211 isoform X1 [Varroa jacobsoni]
MTQHFVSMHSAGYNELEESRLTKYNREVPSVLAPPTSFGHQPSSTTENSVPRVENRPDFKVVYVNGGDDVLINNDEATNDEASPRGTMFTAFFFFLSALFARIFRGINRCRPISAPARPQEASFSAVEVERIEEELRKAPKKVQKSDAPVY